MGVNNIKKHLIRVDNKIHTLSDNNEWIYPILNEALALADYEEWGMDDLDGYEQPINKIKYEVSQSEQTNNGSVYRYEIDKSDFTIRSISIN